MISRSQSRRRGRGSNRGGNRPNTPSRGNAAQLLDKYKGLARDAQMSGDRVQQEYYLQYADHYHRVLEEHKSKQDEHQQSQQRGPRKSHGDNDQQDDDTQGQEKPKRSRRKPESDQHQDAPKAEKQDKPKRTRKPKQQDDGNGDSIADALPPAIGGDEEAA